MTLQGENFLSFALNFSNNLVAAISSLFKMLLNENLETYYKVHLKLDQILGTTTFKFSGDNRLVESTSKTIKFEYFNLTLHSIYVLILWIQLLKQKEEESLNTCMQSYTFALMFLLFCLTKWVVLSRRQMYVELYNLLIRFETDNFPKKGKTVSIFHKNI